MTRILICSLCLPAGGISPFRVLFPREFQLKTNMDSFKGHVSEYSINKLAELNGRARTIASEVQAKIRNVDDKHRVGGEICYFSARLLLIVPCLCDDRFPIVSEKLWMTCGPRQPPCTPMFRTTSGWALTTPRNADMSL